MKVLIELQLVAVYCNYKLFLHFGKKYHFIYFSGCTNRKWIKKKEFDCPGESARIIRIFNSMMYYNHISRGAYCAEIDQVARICFSEKCFVFTKKLLESLF